MLLHLLPSIFMANTVLIGAQWGDEGKGKIIDVLTDQVDVVVRSQGDNNAGHTILFGKRGQGGNCDCRCYFLKSVVLSPISNMTGH